MNQITYIDQNHFKDNDTVCYCFHYTKEQHLAIALVAFPDKPLVAIALVIGPLIELPVLALASQILLWIGRKGFFMQKTG